MTGDEIIHHFMWRESSEPSDLVSEPMSIQEFVQIVCSDLFLSSCMLCRPRACEMAKTASTSTC